MLRGMMQPMVLRLTLFFALLAGGLGLARADEARAPAPRPAEVGQALPADGPRYVEGEAHPGGTGRYYFGREIAAFMSHHGADWLERAEREQEEAPSRLHEWLAVPRGAAVADVGAGTGYHSRRLATAVGPTGRVYAADVQPEMLERLREGARAANITHIETVLSSPIDPGLPSACCELILLVDVYHELAHPYEFTRRLVEALRPGGRLVIVEYRAKATSPQDAAPPIHALHTMTEAQLLLEMAVQPLEWEATFGDLPWQFAMAFRKPG
jgi:ubiquinone/menaquinone biosynthesis C-methylase UbiE